MVHMCIFDDCIGTRSYSFFVDDIFYDEQIILDNIESLLMNGVDLQNVEWPLYITVGLGYSTYVFFYPILLISKIVGLNAIAIRICQQLLTSLACALFSYGVYKWNQNKESFFVTLYVSLTLPWGIVQANRIWDPAFVPIYFSIYFVCFSILMKNDNLSKIKKWACSIVGFGMLVILAVVYPPCRIPAVAIWIISFIWAVKEERISISHSIGIVLTCMILSIPLVINMLNPEFNSRSAELFVIKGESIRQEIFQFFKNFASLFNPSFLFVTGDVVSRHSLPIFGMLGTISIIPIYKQIKSGNTKLNNFFWVVIVTTFISVALTDDYNPHSLRSCLAWLPFSGIIAFGLKEILTNIGSKVKTFIILGEILFFAIWMLFYVMISKGAWYFSVL